MTAIRFIGTILTSFVWFLPCTVGTVASLRGGRQLVGELSDAWNVFQTWLQDEQERGPPELTVNLLGDMDPILNLQYGRTIVVPETVYNASSSESRGRPPLKQPKVVGGSDAGVSDAPWFALMMTRDIRGDWVARGCGASLISPRHALTAAHCVDDRLNRPSKNTEAVLVHAYKPFDSTGNNGGAPSHFSETLSYTIPDSYDAKTLYDDVAIITLKTPVTDLVTFPPIALADTTVPDGTIVSVYGLGRLTERSSEKPQYLQTADMEFINEESCYMYHGNDIQDSMVCAGYWQGQIDACSGDSGGPLVVANPESQTLQQIGIVSWGDGCARFWSPGVYTSVPATLGWIQDQVCPPLSHAEASNTPICSSFLPPQQEEAPTQSPSVSPTTTLPTAGPSVQPSISTRPSNSPSPAPSNSPSVVPSVVPSTVPSQTPSSRPSASLQPSNTPSAGPSSSGAPSAQPTLTKSSIPSASLLPTSSPVDGQFGLAQAERSSSCLGDACSPQSTCCPGYTCQSNVVQWYQDMTLPSRVCQEAPSSTQESDNREKASSGGNRGMRTGNNRK